MTTISAAGAHAFAVLIEYDPTGLEWCRLADNHVLGWIVDNTMPMPVPYKPGEAPQPYPVIFGSARDRRDSPQYSRDGECAPAACGDGATGILSEEGRSCQMRVLAQNIAKAPRVGSCVIGGTPGNVVPMMVENINCETRKFA